jgi:hypothetical protein
VDCTTKHLPSTARFLTATARGAKEATTAACRTAMSRDGQAVQVAVAMKVIYCCMFGRWCCFGLTKHL